MTKAKCKYCQQHHDTLGDVICNRIKPMPIQKMFFFKTLCNGSWILYPNEIVIPTLYPNDNTSWKPSREIAPSEIRAYCKSLTYRLLP